LIAAVTYSTENFAALRMLNVNTAYSKGKADIVFEFTPTDIDDEFKKSNKNIFLNKKGAGLWLWKPYCIKKALSLVNDGDFLIYSDAGSYYINSIYHLIKALENSRQDIMVFELPLISKQWTKKETFMRLNSEQFGFEERNQVLANFLLLKKTAVSIAFINDYLASCCDEVAISPTIFNQEIENPKAFLAHRSDQSILSILSMKYGLKPFRDPSQFGERPWEYILSGEIIYAPVTSENSEYPTIFLLTRKKVNKQMFELKHWVKRILTHLPVYVSWEIKRRKNRPTIYNQ